MTKTLQRVNVVEICTYKFFFVGKDIVLNKYDEMCSTMDN